MWRTLALLGRPPGWLVGAVTALLGIAHAAVQNRLSRVIAYSSAENTGLILTGFGVALTRTAVGNRLLVATGLLAEAAVSGTARRSAGRRSPVAGRRRPPSAGAPGRSNPSGRRA